MQRYSLLYLVLCILIVGIGTLFFLKNSDIHRNAALTPAVKAETLQDGALQISIGEERKVFRSLPKGTAERIKLVLEAKSYEEN